MKTKKIYSVQIMTTMFAIIYLIIYYSSKEVITIDSGWLSVIFFVISIIITAFNFVQELRE